MVSLSLCFVRECGKCQDLRYSDEDSAIVLLFRFFNSPLTNLDLRWNDIDNAGKQLIRTAWKAKESDLQL